MRKDQILVLLLVLLLPMTGCFGGVGDAQAEDNDDNDTEAPWINDTGTNQVNWSVSLSENQWLEVKSALGLIVYAEGTSQEETAQRGLLVSEINGWYISTSGFSPIFGGEYSICGMRVDDGCYSTDPDGDWNFANWSIIYRIHSV